MTTKIDKIVQSYKSLAKIPALVGAEIQSANVINSTWSQRNYEKGSTTKFSRTFLINNLQTSEVTLPLDVSSEILSRVSKSQKLKAVLRESDSKQFLEIWKDSNFIRVVDLAALDVHGNIYADGEFSSFEFSPDETKILYVAEKKIPKSEPFYKRKKAEEPKQGGDAPKPAPKGEEYLFEQDWGEQLVGKKLSVIAEYHIESDTVEILKGLPENVCFAQPKYSSDGTYIVGVTYFIEPRKLGLIYCTNRPSTIFQLDFEGNYLELDLKDKSVKSPIFTPDGKQLIWLEREVGGPHHSCMALVKTNLPLSKNSQIKTVVDIVQKERKISNNRLFYGIYSTGFAKRPWLDNSRIFLNTNQRYTVNSYVINIENGDITELEYDNGSQVVLDVNDNLMLALRRNFLIPDRLVLGQLPQAGSESSIEWKEVALKVTVPELEGATYKYFNISVPEDSVSDFNAIYLGPSTGKDKEVPLILWPHGGPHSAFANCFFLEEALFLSLGYAILLVNYRGSTGSGKDSVDFLPGKVGDADVKDCIRAVDTVIKEFSWINPDKMVLCGGSHGGFLVTHLSGQYPDMFRAVVARNPVIDIASMSVISDIPDWCYVEGGHPYTQKGPLDDDLVLKMRDKSPIVHAHKVKAPTMLQIGSKDLRVPPHQGTEWYHRLKANSVKVRMNLYDDNHPLASVPNEMDNIINAALWFEEHLERE